MTAVTEAMYRRYRQQAEAWVRRALDNDDKQRVAQSTIDNVLPDALRHYDESSEAERAEKRRVIAQFFDSTDGALPDTILLVCKNPKHRQACLCPFMWFAHTNELRRNAVATLAELSLGAPQT